MAKKIRVGVAGYGTIGQRLADGVALQGDMELVGIADLAAKVRKCYFSVPKEKRAPGLRITVSASVFVPKPHTPFEWAPQLDTETVIRRQKMLKAELAKLKGVDFKYHTPEVSYLEAVIARGDRRVADALLLAHRAGCRFDSWTEFFDNEKWLKAFEDAGIDPGFYATRERSTDEVLPWAHIDAGVCAEFLKREWEKALRGETTRDCRQGCVGCGMKRYEGACE